MVKIVKFVCNMYNGNGSTMVKKRQPKSWNTTNPYCKLHLVLPYIALYTSWIDISIRDPVEVGFVVDDKTLLCPYVTGIVCALFSSPQLGILHHQSLGFTIIFTYLLSQCSVLFSLIHNHSLLTALAGRIRIKLVWQDICSFEKEWGVVHTYSHTKPIFPHSAYCTTGCWLSYRHNHYYTLFKSSCSNEHYQPPFIAWVSCAGSR